MPHLLLLLLLCFSFPTNSTTICRYEKFQADGQTRYAFVGFTSVYQYYAYPDNIRPRISQMLVLPPFQRLGVGAEMLRTIYIRYQEDPKVLDITGERERPGCSNEALLPWHCVCMVGFQVMNRLSSTWTAL